MSMMTSPAPAPALAPSRPVRAPLARPTRRRSDHLRVVAPSERTRRRLRPSTAVAISVLLFAIFSAVAVSQTLIVQAQVRLDDLDAQLSSEQARYQELRSEVARFESPERIVEAAHQQGMVTPDDLVYLRPDGPDVPDASVDAADGDGSGSVDGGRVWSTIKPLLEAPTR